MKWYFMMNVALAVALLVFAAVDVIFRRKKLNISFKHALRAGQFALLFSLVLPIIASWLPHFYRPPVPERIWQPLSEMSTGVENLSVSLPLPSGKPHYLAASPAHSTAYDVYSLSTLLLVISIWLLLAKKWLAAQSLKQQLKHALKVKSLGSVQIVVSSQFSVPFSTRLGSKAWIALPEEMLLHWRDFQLAVKHEIQHHRQLDTLWALAIEILSACFWWNPAIYFWRRRLSELQELSCDEALIGRKVSRYEYGSCLVRVAEAALGNTRLLVGTAGMAGVSGNPKQFKSVLRRRIEMLIEIKKSRGRLGGWIQGTLAVLVALSVCSLMESSARAAKQDSVASSGIVSVDPAIQNIAEQALEAALTRHKASMGFVVVADPNNGKILAVANKDKVANESDLTPHWALGLRLGPASLTKALAISMAIEKGLTTPGEIHDCGIGHYSFGGKVYRDWKPFGKISTAEVLTQSSNIGGIKIGQKLGLRGVQETFSKFGFGPGGSAEDFPEARVGEILSPAEVSAPYFIASGATGYGGNFVTPIEVVQAFGAIANGGTLLKPQTGDNAKREEIRRVLSEQTSQTMKKLLAEVLISGTAQNSDSKLYHLAGKTATGYSRSHVNHDTLGGESNFASFAGFGPVENPRVVIYVGVENPTDGTGVHGSTHAAPVFREVAEKSLQYLKVPVQN